MIVHSLCVFLLYSPRTLVNHLLKESTNFCAKNPPMFCAKGPPPHSQSPRTCEVVFVCNSFIRSRSSALYVFTSVARCMINVNWCYSHVMLLCNVQMVFIPFTTCCSSNLLCFAMSFRQACDFACMHSLLCLSCLRACFSYVYVCMFVCFRWLFVRTFVRLFTDLCLSIENTCIYGFFVYPSIHLFYVLK